MVVKSKLDGENSQYIISAMSRDYRDKKGGHNKKMAKGWIKPYKKAKKNKLRNMPLGEEVKDSKFNNALWEFW